jgi:ElaB/YqjD/DUF883 family membrane-anchored ribosome-binding protein
MRQTSSTEAIVERLQEAAAAIERSTRHTGKSFRRFYRDSAGTAGDAQHVLSDEWESLKGDLADLMANADISRSPEARAVIERMRSSIAQASDTVADIAHSAQRRARHSAEAVDEYVHESPWASAGVAAVVGLAIGLLLSQTSSRR